MALECMNFGERIRGLPPKTSDGFPNRSNFRGSNLPSCNKPNLHLMDLMEENIAPIDMENHLFCPGFIYLNSFAWPDVLPPALPNMKNQCHSVILVLLRGDFLY